MGELAAGGRSRPVTEADLDHYRQLQGLQRQQRVPLLQPAADPHAFVYFALFDGTGQDMGDASQPRTNIGKLAEQLDALRSDPSIRIGMDYVEGIGTQAGALARTLDGLLAFSWDEKLEDAYRNFAIQAKTWQELDPDARISLIGVGYSRGAVLTAGLLRLVDTYGIANPDDLRFGRDAHGNVTVESGLPPLVPPGRTPQIAGLFDPVGTNMPRDYDARLNPRTLAGFSIIASDEARRWFPHQAIVEPGLSADRRMLNGAAAGGHANTGGGSGDALLDTLAYNSMTDFLNAPFERPPLRALALPGDPARSTSHQVGGLTAGLGLAVDRDGRRDLRDGLANCVIVDPCRDSEPVDAAFAARFAWRTVTPTWTVPTLAAPTHALADAEHATPVRDTRETPTPANASRSPDEPGHPDHARLQQIRDGVRAVDAAAGRVYDDRSERLSRALLAASKDGGDVANAAPDGRAALSRVDHVVLGTDARYLFAVQGGLQDPLNRFAGVLVEKAMATPVEQADARLAEANARIEAAQARDAEQVQVREASAQSQSQSQSQSQAPPVLSR